MKLLKINSILFLLTLALAASCTKDDDSDGGGSNDARDKFVGSYKVVESCSSTGNNNPNMTIAKSSSGGSNAVLITFIYPTEQQVIRATVSGNTININDPNVSIPGTPYGLSIQGSGTLNGNILTMLNTYTFSAGLTESCSQTATKQ